jgi:hypothetical protein
MTLNSKEAAAAVTPVQAAELLADLADVIIPGDESWPSAATVGAQGMVATRLIEELGEAELARIAPALLRAGGPLAGCDEAAKVAIVCAFEVEEPALFGWLRDAIYLAYYESPFVAAAIRAKGRPYELRPHVTGYPLPPFDLARDTPRHGRGRYVPTDAVPRLDAEPLDLASERTTVWGLSR